MNHINLQLKELEKEQQGKTQSEQRKEIIKNSAEINNIKTIYIQ